MFSVAGLLLAFVVGRHATVAAPPSLCLPADTISDAAIRFAKGFIGDTSAFFRADRDSLGISGVTVPDVALSSDTTACSKASQRLDALAGVGTTGRKVYLFTAGASHFFVVDPKGMTPEGRPIYLFDSHFTNPYVLLGP
jgi:hypothetical protein